MKVRDGQGDGGRRRALDRRGRKGREVGGGRWVGRWEEGYGQEGGRSQRWGMVMGGESLLCEYILPKGKHVRQVPFQAV